MRKKMDFILLIDILVLVAFGLLMVFSASNVVANYKYSDAFYYFKRQLIFGFVGIFLMYVISRIDLQKIYKLTFIIFFVSILLLALVLIPGIGSVRGGARSWIGFGIFSIQPAEFAKITCVLFLARFLSNNYQEMTKFRYFLFLLMIVGVIFGIIMLQPDFGTGLVLVLTCIALIFLSGAKMKFFIFLGIVGVALFIGLIISAPYRLERIFSFIDPWQDPLGSGFQGIQSLFAVAPSGIFGFGYNNSIQKHFFLPEPQNDFIFAIITEELGLFGGIFLLSLYFILFIRGFRISIRVNNIYKAFLARGITCMILIQVIINICVVIGLLPITGITLPFISYGGSSLVMTLMSVGILLNISRDQLY